MMLSTWTDIAVIVGTVVAAVALIGTWLGGLRAELRRSLQDVGQRIDDVTVVTQLNTQALSILLPSVTLRADAKANRNALDSLAPKLMDALASTIAQEHHWHNPLTRDELQRLESYKERLEQHRELTPDELRDMKDLADRVHAEHPDDKSSLTLALLAGLFLALLLSTHPHNN
jgi:hypothetical protein